MRTARIVEDGSAYYHIMSRVVDRRQVFDDGEKERFRKTLRAVAGFAGVEILTWSCLSNHWHVLAYVPQRQEVDDQTLGKRLSYLYDQTLVDNLLSQLAALRAAGQPEAAAARKRDYTYRMNDLGEFVKTLKQRVSLSYNRRHQRKGTLWEERYKSLLVEGQAGTLTRVAAYIDLNAVRAGLVSDPKDYRYSGYGEAMGGSKLAREGLMAVVRDGEAREMWAEAAARYRQMLYVSGEARGAGETGQPTRKGFSPAAVEAVMEQRGKLPVNEILRSRVRYFTDGAIIGSRVFVEDAFGRHRAHFSPKREVGAKAMKGGAWGDMFTARQLRVDVIGSPAPV